MIDSIRRFVVPAIFAAATMVAQLPGSAAASQDYAAALDRETGGLFSRAVAKGNTDFAIENYPALITAFVRIEDAYFAAYSPDANDFPGWYAEHLGALGLHGISTPEASAFFEAELSSGDFDRVVHAYYILGRSKRPLLVGAAPTSLWQKLVATAREDPEDRYWISLALAEASALPAHAYEERHTKMATRTESVYDRIAKNADSLGPAVVRVLGLSERGERVSQLHVENALTAAKRRVIEHEMKRLGPDAAYESIRERLERLERGAFDSKRFLSLMQEDLPVLHQRFGAPRDAAALLETLRAVCRGLGQNRMELWAAADSIAKLYEPALAARPAEPAAAPRPDAAAIRALGGTGAHAYLMSTLSDARDAEGVLQLFREEMIPTVVAAHPPADPASLREAIRSAYYRVGNPPALYPAFLRAVASLGPEESNQGAISGETMERLRGAFTASRDAASFARAFESFRQASNQGKLPRRGADPEFVRAFGAAAIRVIEAEDRDARLAEERMRQASAAGASASSALREAVTAVADANVEVRNANEQVGSFDERQRSVMAARNQAVARLNQAVDRANAAGRGPDAEAARAEAKRLGAELGAEIEQQDAAFQVAVRDLEEAERRGAVAAQRASEAEARAKIESARAAASLEAEQRAATAAHKSRSRFKTALGRLISGLGFVGIEITEADAPAGNPSVAELAALLDAGGESGWQALATRALALSRAAAR